MFSSSSRNTSNSAPQPTTKRALMSNLKLKFKLATCCRSKANKDYQMVAYGPTSSPPSTPAQVLSDTTHNATNMYVLIEPSTIRASDNNDYYNYDADATCAARDTAAVATTIQHDATPEAVRCTVANKLTSTVADFSESAWPSLSQIDGVYECDEDDGVSHYCCSTASFVQYTNTNAYSNESYKSSAPPVATPQSLVYANDTTAPTSCTYRTCDSSWSSQSASSASSSSSSSSAYSSHSNIEQTGCDGDVMVCCQPHVARDHTEVSLDFADRVHLIHDKCDALLVLKLSTGRSGYVPRSSLIYLHQFLNVVKCLNQFKV